MTTTLNASTAGAGGFIATSDNSGVLALQTAGTTAITVDTAQNVGIGTSSPSTKLHVKSTANDVLTVESTNTYAFLDFTNPTGTAGIGNTGNAMRFDTGGSERMRIDSSGNLLVGTTSSNGRFTASLPNGTTSNALSTNSVTTASTSWYHFVGQSGNGTSITTNNIFIYGNGNIQNTNNSYGAISDVKLKENIVDATPKLADLMQVKVRNYNLKNDPTHKQIGVIAQELEQIFPSMIEESFDKDFEGNDLGTTTKAVKYSVFVPMLIKAIQELKAINDTQAETITALTARVVALEAK